MNRFDGSGKQKRETDGLSSLDRISYLPMNVIDGILTKLSLIDAVKTSILSREWRDTWTSLSSLVFHCCCLYLNIENAVYRVLLRHSSAIDKFELRTGCCLKASDIDQWMLILRERAIKAICLQFSIHKGQRYKLHSCLFSCNLTHLELHDCIFQPPPTFKGFKNLKFLSLNCVTIHNDVLNRLMHSDQLEDVHLSYLEGINLLKIHSPNLKKLALQDAFDDIFLAKSPVLYKVFIDYNGGRYQHLKRVGTNNLISFLGYLPAIKKLTLSGPFFKFLATSSTIPLRLPLMMNRLELLRLDFYNFKVDEISAVFSIIRSSPNLKMLQIAVFDDVDNFLKEPYLRDCCFSQLQHVQLNLCGNRWPGTELIKFILAHSPLLESMDIGYSREDISIVSVVSKEVMSFERASPHAIVTIF